jgi:hypothetical protein
MREEQRSESAGRVSREPIRLARLNGSVPGAHACRFRYCLIEYDP